MRLEFEVQMTNCILLKEFIGRVIEGDAFSAVDHAELFLTDYQPQHVIDGQKNHLLELWHSDLHYYFKNGLATIGLKVLSEIKTTAEAPNSLKVN